MDYDSAKLLLLMHGSGTTDDDGNILVADDGFLQMLRPYRGLKEDNFHRVLQAVFVVGDRLHSQEHVERELMNTLWSLCSTSRSWGLNPKGMLQRNRLITEADSRRLESWIDILEWSIEGVLNGCPPHFRVIRYAEYLTTYGPWSNVSFFLPYMVRYLQDDDETMDPTSIANALARIGDAAESTLPALHAASKRVFADWCNEEAQAAIAEAISQIETSTKRR